MKIYDLSFADGKSCRVIDPDPDEDEAESLRSYQAMFQPGYLISMERIFAPPPEKLPWQQQAKGLWTLGLFVLRRLDSDTFSCSWPGCEVVGDKDAISATIRLRWREGV